MLCSWERHSSLKGPHSTQVFNRIPTNLIWRDGNPATDLASYPGSRRNTSSDILLKPEIPSTGMRSTLYSLLNPALTLPYLKLYVKYLFSSCHPEQSTEKFVFKTNPSFGFTLHLFLGTERGFTVGKVKSSSKMSPPSITMDAFILYVVFISREYSLPPSLPARTRLGLSKSVSIRSGKSEICTQDRLEPFLLNRDQLWRTIFPQISPAQLDSMIICFLGMTAGPQL